MKKSIGKILQKMFTVIFILCIFSNCEKPAQKQNDILPNYNSFRDIPGITEDEIKAIEALQLQKVSFVYGTTPSTEAFSTENGEIKGFTALFCDWLTKIFGIPFIPEIYAWSDLIHGLETFEIDFTGELTATDERLRTYIMSDAIAERSIKIFRITKSIPLADIAQSRPVRYAFLEGTTTVNAVLPTLAPDTYETIFIDNSALAYDLLASGEADAFINEGPGELNFDNCLDVVATEYFPLIYEPVSMSTQNPALRPVISVVQKMLRMGGIRYLTGLYNLGYKDYIKQKLFKWLSDEERSYLRNHSPIPLAAEGDNYPLSFYDKREKAWHGIIFDLLSEVTELTGLRFEPVNDPNADWPLLLKMLENREAAFISELIPLPERKNLFIWPETVILDDHYALISKMDHRDISINEILYVKTGLIRNTAYTETFRYWFPNHLNTVEYEDMAEAFAALQRGEVDMVMASLNKLLFLTNYEELPDYKANVVFENFLESKFGFNKNEDVLCSIIDKSLRLIDTKGISDHWLRRTYDYRVKVAEAQRPWLIGSGVLLLNVFILTFVLFIRSRQEGKRLESLVTKRTSELEAVTKDLEIAVETAEAASLSKSQFLANMSHEIRTPMNAILGITEILLRNETLKADVKEPLNKIYNSGDLLLNIINDILDLSKIEAGKLELSPAKYEAASLVNDTATLNMMRIGSKPIEFKLSVDENLPSTLFGDELRIKQILNNVLSNAFKYTEKGEVRLSVSVEKETGNASESDEMIVAFSVSDTGQGMTKDQLSELFDEYSRFNMEANRTTEGTGLGMSITRKLIVMMNGDISVESEPGKGTVLTVRLPQKTTGSGVLGRELTEYLQNFKLSGIKQLSKAEIAYEPMPYGSILVVDDVETNLYVAKGLMSPYGMVIDTAGSGFEAIDKINSGKSYDIVFMDHMMPIMDGIETTKKIRELGYKHPIVALTANAVVGQSDVFLQNGFDDFISKPIDTRQLNSILKKFVRDKQPIPAVQPSINQELAGLFVKDAVKALAALEDIRKRGTYDDEDIKLYTINTHGMKSALANIGERELSAAALRLEQAGRANDMAIIIARTPDFLTRLRATIEKFSPRGDLPQ